MHYEYKSYKQCYLNPFKVFFFLQLNHKNGNNKNKAFHVILFRYPVYMQLVC